MALKFTVHGIEVTATDAVEAARLIRELAAQSPAPERNVLPPRRRIKSTRPIRRAVGGFNVARATVAFLTIVNQAGDDGAAADEIMPALVAKKPKGTGARLAKVNNHLRGIGFAPEDVYSHQRSRKGPVWVARGKMNAALDAARKVER